MKMTEFKLEYSTVKEQGSIPVIIVAAGSSTRMKGISKQFVSLCGIPAIVHTLSAFERNGNVSKIILVTKEEYISEMQIMADKYGITKLTDIVKGGATRQDSVKNGLKLLNGEKYALIHDGARPLVNDKVIDAVIGTLTDFDCVVCGVKVKDTVKRVDSDDTVQETVDRSNLISVQTPQGVNVSEYIKILEKIDTDALTDDASAFEKAGYAVKVVEGDYKNIKITTREDIELAEYYLEKGEPEQ